MVIIYCILAVIMLKKMSFKNAHKLGEIDKGSGIQTLIQDQKCQ